MADLLQKRFCSVFSDPNSNMKKEPEFPPVSESLEDIQFEMEDIMSAIDALSANSAPGEDGSLLFY